MIVGRLGTVIFSVSKTTATAINNGLKRKHTAKITEHNPIFGVGMLRHQGRELQEITFTMTLTKALTGSVTKKKNSLIELMELGEVVNLVLGGQVVGRFPFLVTEIEEENTYFNTSLGAFDKIDLSVTLKEYIEDPKTYNETIALKKALINSIKTTIETEVNVLTEQVKAVVSK